MKLHILMELMKPKQKPKPTPEKQKEPCMCEHYSLLIEHLGNVIQERDKEIQHLKKDI